VWSSSFLNAQILPPSTAYEWSEGAGSSDWADGGNWSGGAEPPDGVDVIFGNVPSGLPWDAKAVNNTEADRKLRSLWFETGFDYTLGGASLLLGGGLGDGDRLITVLNRITRHSEVTFNSAINVSTANPSDRFLIHNESLGGLRFNGAFNTGGHEIWLEGSGPIRFSGAISGVSGGAAGTLRVKMAEGHAMFTADNSAWGGTIHVDSGMAVVGANGSLGSTALTTTVADGATLALRQRNWGLGGYSFSYTDAKTLELVGDGIWRFGEGHVGALYNDGGNNTFSGNITLIGDTSIGSRVNTFHLSGAITGAASLTKIGRGILRLSNAGNAYTGATIIKGGALWIHDEAALQGGFGNTNTGTAIVLDGGVLMLSPVPVYGEFRRKLGIGPGQIQWTGSGGFAAAGSNTQIQLTNENDVQTGKLTWGQSGFVPIGSALLFGAEGTQGIVTLRNSIDFAGGQREIYVHRNTSADVIGGSDGYGFSNGGVIKTGQGRLSLRGTYNYTGPTVILDGLFSELLRDIYGPVQTNYQLGGGTLDLASPWVNGAKTYLYSPMLGAGAGQIQWLAGSDGGLAIMEGISGTLRINGSQDEITWGQQYFVGLDNTLILGHRESSTVNTWDTALNLAGGERTIYIVDSLVNPSQGPILAEFRFTQALRNGSLRLVGDGRLDLAVANPNLLGSVTVSGAELRLNAGGTLSGISSLRAERGGRITLDNAGTYNATTGGAYLADRVNTTASVTLDGGTLRFWGSDVANSISTQTFGAVTLEGGASTIDVVNHAGASGSATLHLTSLSQSDLSATLNFTNAGSTETYSESTTGLRLRFVTAPSLSGGILPYATVHGSEWATVTTGGYLVAYSGYETGTPTGWLAAHNVSLNQYRFASGTLTINSLRFASGGSLNLSNFSTTLSLVSGGIIASGSSVMQLGRLTTDADFLYVHIPSGRLDVTTEIFGAAGLVKSGGGLLRLHGTEANTYTGTTYVHDGILALEKLIGVNAIAGDLVVGDFKSTTTVTLVNSHQIADTATVTLRGVMHQQPTIAANIREGVLQFNNVGASPGLREAFDRLHIDGRGVLNFGGGEYARANYLLLNRLTFADTSSRLIIRNWVEFEDYLLVRRVGNAGLIPPILSQIIFDGYGPARWVPYDNDHWQITPFPEPATYGAILGALGIGLWGWRKRKKTCQPLPAKGRVE